MNTEVLRIGGRSGTESEGGRPPTRCAGADAAAWVSSNRRKAMRIKATMAVMAMLAGCSGAEQRAHAQSSDEVFGTLLVANKRGNSLVRVDLASGARTHEVDSCANPHELAVSPDRTHVALACYSGQELETYRPAHP